MARMLQHVRKSQSDTKKRKDVMRKLVLFMFLAQILGSFNARAQDNACNHGTTDGKYHEVYAASCSLNNCVNDAYLNQIECQRLYPERALDCQRAYEMEVRYCHRVCK